MLISDMINQVKCTELCGLKKSVLKGGLFLLLIRVKKAGFFPPANAEDLSFKQLITKEKYIYVL